MLLVRLHENVPHHAERDHVGVVPKLLRDGVREAGEQLHLHPHREDLALSLESEGVRLVR